MSPQFLLFLYIHLPPTTGLSPRGKTPHDSKGFTLTAQRSCHCAAMTMRLRRTGDVIAAQTDNGSPRPRKRQHKTGKRLNPAKETAAGNSPFPQKQKSPCKHTCMGFPKLCPSQCSPQREHQRLVDIVVVVKLVSEVGVTLLLTLMVAIAARTTLAISL